MNVRDSSSMFSHDDTPLEIRTLFVYWMSGGQLRLISLLRGSPAIGIKKCSPAGIRTRVLWVRTTYPDQLDYGGLVVSTLSMFTLGSDHVYERKQYA